MGTKGGFWIMDDLYRGFRFLPFSVTPNDSLSVRRPISDVA